MSLGSFFPADFARMQIERQLQPGMVVKFMAKMDDGRMHEKRFVILDVSVNSFTCVINSNISPFLAHRPDAMKCQVLIDAAQHPFMSWDSHVDCSRVRTYKTSELVDQLFGNPEWILGMTTNELREQMVAALKASKTVSVSLATQCCLSLNQTP